MIENLFNKALSNHEKILTFAKLNHDSVLEWNNYTQEHHNYITDGKKKYFLSLHNWNIIYEKMLNNHLLDKGEKFDLIRSQENIRLTKLASIIKENIQDLLLVEIEKLTGRPVKVVTMLESLQDLASHISVDHISTIIFHKLEDHVTNAVLKNQLNEDFELEITETSLSNSLGSAVFNTFFYSLKDYTDLLNAKNSKDAATFENFFIFIFNKYNANPNDLSVSDLELISDEIQESFDITIKDLILVDFFCKKTITLVIKNILEKANFIGYLGIERFFNKEKITNAQLYIIDNLIKSLLTEHNVVLGSIFINKLIEADILESFYNPKYGKAEAEDKDLHVKSKGESTLTLRLKQDLIYDFTLNASTFKPLLTEQNFDIMPEDFKVYKQDVIINFKLSALREKIHVNKTGKGSFNPESPFSKERNISNVYLSIDCDFLENYLSLIKIVSGKKFSDFITEEEKDNLYLFLSFYEINFQEIEKNLSPEYKMIFDKVIEISLEICENPNPQLLKDLVEQIKKITNKAVKQQFLSLIDKIRAYKLMLILALQEYIVYRCFNYCIMPSYFDFRGRRYFIGLAFNVQSYPFLKAFIKLYETFEMFITEQNFNKVRDSMLDIIKDNTLQDELRTKMSSLKTYEKLIVKEAINFIYSHINPEKMTFNAFEEFFFNDSVNFFIIYKTLLCVIKKNSKALIMASYILLEKRKRHKPISYANNLSYDMVTSGYQMTALVFPEPTLGRLANLIGTELFDLYLDLASNQKAQFLKSIKLFKLFIKEVFNINVSKTIKYASHNVTESLSLFQNWIVQVNTVEHEYQNLLPLYKDNYICDNILSLKDLILNHSWVLFPCDKTYLKTLVNSKKILTECFLILGRISLLDVILMRNNWLLDRNIIGSRTLVKHLIMIEIYGGTRRGRYKAYKRFIDETCMELGVFFENISDSYLLFYYIENYYALYKREKLQGIQRIVKIGKILSAQEQIVIIKNPNFMCQLSPTKFISDKRIQINSVRLHVKRKPYQLTLNKPNFTQFTKMTDASIIINTNKLASLFPPDFIHSMDAMVPQLGIIKIDILNKLLQDLNLKFSLVTIHDNFSVGRALFPILPEIIKGIYKEIFEYNYLNSLKDNFTAEEFEDFISENQIQNPFITADISNPHMMKYG